MTERLLEIVPKHYHRRIQSLVKEKKLDVAEIVQGLQSKNARVVKDSRVRLAQALQIKPSSLRLKRKKETTNIPPDIPFLDLMKEYFSNPKDEKQFDILQKLVLLNKTYYKTFHQHLDRIQDQIKMIVTLCHFFDLTRKYPKNTFQHRVGVHFYLQSLQKERTDYQIYLEGNHFYLYQQPYTDNKKPSLQNYPNNKKGFIQLLDVFVPIFRKSEFALKQRWDLLRPLTPFDKQILARYHLNRMSPVIMNKNKKENKVFVVNSETISYWDQSYLKNSPW